MNQEQKNTFSVPAAILLGAIIIAGAIIWVLHPSSPTQIGTGPDAQQNQTAPTPAVDIKQVKTAGDPFIGQADAPVTIAFWFDYQCPFCKQDEEDVIPQVIKDYVSLGKAKIVFKDFAFLGSDSMTASIAARAVWDVAPDQFYAWHKAMFDAQEGENSGWATKDAILNITKGVLGQADTTKVSALMTSNASLYTDEINADKQEGSTLGINGTPAMIIGKQLIIGAQPYENVQAAIDAAIGSKN
jgi:protein-disulfide isomerase